ncbi:MAG: long-chain fatty acid--CoA ligase [Bacteroidota bacterium]|nr:long-chain fatty acid--CoA ligase [Bacteroidota bacterium]
MEITRTFDLLERYKNNFANKKDVLATKQNGEWIKYTTQQYIDYSYYSAYGLLALGLNKGDKIITITNNRPEWNFVDMGMSMAGIIHVPVFTSLSNEEYKKIIKHSDASLVIVSDKKLFNKINTIAKEIEAIKEVYTFDKIEGAKNYQEIIELGKKSKSYYQEEVEKIKSEITTEDFATLIYTSGTTGTSKGVMLSHKNLVRNFLAAAGIFTMKADEKYLSILPLCHVGGRMGNYQTQYSGTSIYYAENMGTMAANMKEIQPHGFDTVPRILEKVFDNVIAKGKKLKGFKKSLFFWAVDLGLKFKIKSERSFVYNIKLKIADKLIFSKWREALGGKIEKVGCGGASLQPRLERVFWAAGIKVLNMYGLTETSPIITINRSTEPDLKFGSVGALIEGVELKISHDGEILCKGHNVMLGYYKDPELTKSVFDDEGWFHTGDIGHIDDDNFLFVTDRKKEIFKLSSGKFVAPQIIENKLKESEIIEQSIVFGEHEKFASALIYPNFSYLKDWCVTNNLSCNSNNEIIQSPQIFDFINKEIKKINNTLNDSERIKRFKLVSDEWTPESGELSPTLKLKRKFIEKKYEKIIEQIFAKQTI